MMNEIVKGEEFLVFHRAKNDEGCVAVEFCRMPPGLKNLERQTTPEENETAESLLRTWFSSPKVIDEVVESLIKAKGKFT